MIILGIETSCDETALSLIEATGGLSFPRFRLIGSSLFSQAHLHAEFGGVYPNLARREHQKNLMPLFRKLIADAEIKKNTPAPLVENSLKEILAREPELLKDFLEWMPKTEKIEVDAIAVTSGPGLEPALWVGISFAKALGEIWNVPVVATNHMEGHIVSVLIDRNESEVESEKLKVNFPALALLISGGHTELIEIQSWNKMQILGSTRDDAVGEAFDKVARILDLPYPGGPEVSRLAGLCRARGGQTEFKLPRPMIHSKDYEFSFAGLKTAVLYAAKAVGTLNTEQKENIACEFEDAVSEVLLEKTRQALLERCSKTLVIGGGVISNTYIRALFEAMIKNEFPETTLLIPGKDLTTDNAVMIAMAAYIDIETGATRKELTAKGNLAVSR